MTTNAAELFHSRYRLGGEHENLDNLDLCGVRLHIGDGHGFCRSIGAQAVTIGEDVYFRDGAFAPHSRAGLRLIAHELAHVVQQRLGVARPAHEPEPEPEPGVLVTAANSPEEREADAAADAFLAGRDFTFAERAGIPANAGHGLIAQRYMAWEHAMIGDLTPALVGQAAGRGVDGAADADQLRIAPLEATCALLEQLGRDPRDVDIERLKTNHQGLETVCLPGSGLVITLGELNILPDYVSHPEDIEQASAAFLLPVIQSVRAWNVSELRKSAGRRRTVPKMPEAMFYPRMRGMADIYEAVQIDKVGERCGLAPWQRYSSVISRNAAHFAPFSWFRWQRFHLSARKLIAASNSAKGDERERLRLRARIHAGYADHFLHDSFAAGHLINKTLVMQWFIDWLGAHGVRYADRNLVSTMTFDRQPLLHGAEYYHPAPDGPDGVLIPRGQGESGPRVVDPQTAVEEPTEKARMAASGVVGDTDDERNAAYAAYLAMLASGVAQLAAGVAHGHLNKHSLRVAAGADGDVFRLYGDHALLADGEGAYRTACAAELSRRAISELLEQGKTGIEIGEIFALFPDHVEVDGVLLPLQAWHESSLRGLCTELFGRRRTRFTRTVISLTSRHLGVPSPDCPS